jgi:ATP adenylyltransferase
VTGLLGKNTNGMDVLWAPWRLEYILSEKPDECVFCIPEHQPDRPEESRKKDRNRLILFRGKRVFVIMNKYPYSNGHLMVTPRRHVMDLPDLEPDEAHETMDMVSRCVTILRECFSPDGINVGLNIGKAAGAGIKEHLHFHLVPRWNGDSSFMAVFSETRVMPEHLFSTYDRLRPCFDRLAEGE